MNLRFPIKFEKMTPLEDVDDRFLRVKIYLAHVGENRNNSIFTREILESMIPSLTNVPILGYIAVNDENEPDFLGHEDKIILKDNKIEIRYAGHAYGVIPAENKARFEMRYSDGVEREYLVAEGLLWKKFSEVEEIFDKNGGFKSQSMELEPSSIDGYFNDHGIFVFTKAKFEGACILGEGVTPAMIGSTIERFSASKGIGEELGEMLSEFNKYYSAISEKGEGKLTVKNKDDNEELQVNNNSEFAKNKDKEKDENKDTSKNEGKEEKKETATEKSSKGKKDVEETKDSDKEKEKKEKKSFTRTFELSHDDIRCNLYSALDESPLFNNSWPYIVEVYDKYTYVFDHESGKSYKVLYTNINDEIAISSVEEVFQVWVNASEKQELENVRTNYEVMKDEVDSLRKFKEDTETSQKEKVLSSYSSSLSENDYQRIQESLSSFSSIDEMEKEIGFILLKNNRFSADEEATEKARVTATKNKEPNPYGSAAVYFSK
ncbi:hypothetical protein P8891_05910 [Bacillus atrophaeus]|uniref:hypothetical protein n=1 Tax=Bacillus atrophaeus TaxID=1452 RepID=UPI002282DD41|nr:hypothetical protein [Bacillus atrophaeus]MCY7947025.1 hypothetical protein [Bacillus atrophaeus]MCY8097985.1 hypothetical protein [Bacillus atrophaeus]MCY9170063.1 hypothetical protein [Bacillus atrophaeus]MEC0740617.1 hypothetical protein [Bacillus atrophaeus]MEC0746947.1 hypothetical protein [Bacillus atrophaeus]